MALKIDIQTNDDGEADLTEFGRGVLVKITRPKDALTDRQLVGSIVLLDDEDHAVLLHSPIVATGYRLTEDDMDAYLAVEIDATLVVG